MRELNLVEDTKSQHFDKPSKQQSETTNEGTKEMLPQFPFVIAGGKNTERLYVQHISDITSYKFNVIPRYFGNESNYHKKFPGWIETILKKNRGVKIFCLLDFDTIYNNEKNKINYIEFKEAIFEYTENGTVVLCLSMPCVEYWFLLHFEDTTKLFKTNKSVVEPLLDYMKEYFSVNPNISSNEFADKLKEEKFLEDQSWVEKLCSDGKLETAITRAKENIENAIKNNEKENISYSYIYKLFDEYDISES